MHSGTMLIDSYSSPIKAAGTNYTYWLALLLQFPQFINQHYLISWCLDFGILLLIIVCLFIRKQRWIWASLLLLLFFVKCFTIQLYACSHTKSISCNFVALLPLCFRKEKNAHLMIEFGRYFLIYILVISAYHKFVNGSLQNPENFSSILMHQHLDLATLYPQHISYKIATFLIEHTTLATFLFYILFVTQLCFVLGIFTKQFDKWLFLLLIAFAVLTYFFMRIYNFDILLLGITLIYFKE